MAIYNISFKNTMSKESTSNIKHTNDLLDYGKETYMGISRKYHPTWDGWEILDGNKEGNLDNKVKDFYRVFYWDIIKGTQIHSQTIANKVFDMSVCQGISRTIKYLQISLNILNKNRRNIDEDGIIGNETLECVNSLLTIDIKYLISLMKTLQLNHYIKFSIKDKTQEKFIRGWINRSNYDGS